MQAAAPARPGGASNREVFLDVVRAVAIVRVVTWHTYGVPAITYFVAAIPAMFFVTGSLLAKSMRRRPARTVLADRFRRLLIPIWAFGAVAWGAMALAAWREGSDLPLHRALTWIVPVVDPLGTDWEGGWLTSHLWYLRVLVWLLLLTPPLLWAVRTRHCMLPVGTAVAVVVVLDVVSRSDAPLARLHEVTWFVGDLALYSVFLMLGFLHRDGMLRPVTRRGWLVAALLAGAGAVVWRLTQPVPLGVVNNSHPMHLLVGAAWLAAALAAQRPLARLGESRLLGPAVRAIGRHSLTIYLWHTAAIIVAVNLLEARGVDSRLRHAVGLALLTGVGVAVAVQLFGWIEDLAARRRLRRRRRRPALVVVARPALALVSLVAVGSAALIATEGRSPVAPEAAASTRPARRPPIPSRPPPPPVFSVGKDPAPAPHVLTPQAEQVLPAQFDVMLEQWRTVTGMSGAVVGVAGPTLRWTGATGARPDTDLPTTTGDRIELASLTKLYTAAIVYRLAEAGLIDTAREVPPLRALPEFPPGITVRHLLEHSSGLVNYLDTAQYAADPESIADPVAGVRASLREGLAAAPGERYLYASTNYLVLGLLLEAVTGRPYADLLREHFIGPLGLRATTYRGPEPAWPRGGTAGIETDVADLLTVGVAILRDHAGLSAASFAQMTEIDPASGFGPGTFGFCPCRLDVRGDLQFFAVGYYGATTLLGYAPSLDLVIAVDLVESLGYHGGYDAVSTLFEMVEDVVRRN